MSCNVTVVFGSYQTTSLTENAIIRLKRVGFKHGDISVFMPTHENAYPHLKKTKVTHEGTLGVAGSSILGGALGWLVAMDALAIPGMGPFIEASPALTAFLGALFGGIAAYASSPETKCYETFVKDGTILVSVTAEDSRLLTRAKEILKSTGARNIVIERPMRPLDFRLSEK